MTPYPLPPHGQVWDSLAKLNKGTGAKYIIGVNLEDGDADLALKQAQAALDNLPPGSIETFEVGNEVRMDDG